MVRVYANLSGLSKALSKVKLAGPEKRSLAPFVANFNRSNDLFDFVDAGELKENADLKIRAMFANSLRMLNVDTYTSLAAMMSDIYRSLRHTSATGIESLLCEHQRFITNSLS